MVGRQTPLLALVVPLILVGMVDGARGIRQAWPAAVVGGLTFAVGQFVCSNYISVELTDIVASLLSAGSIVALVQVWSPSEPLRGETKAAARSPRSRAPRSPTPPTRPRSTARRATATTRRGEIAAAFSPYLFIIVVFALAQYGPIKDWLDERRHRVPVARARRPSTPRASAPTSLTYKFGWPNAAGTLLLVAGPADA